jgi:uncharacterized membrane protein
VRTSTVGLIAGLLLGIAAAIGGFWAFLLTLVLGTVGFLVGGQVDGELDLRQVLGSRRRG